MPRMLGDALRMREFDPSRPSGEARNGDSRRSTVSINSLPVGRSLGEKVVTDSFVCVVSVQCNLWDC